MTSNADDLESSDFFLVHPITLRMRLAFLVMGVLLWGKLHFVDSLAALRDESFFDAGELVVPEFVVRYDDSLHGGRMMNTTQRAPVPRVGGGGAAAGNPWP